MDKFFVCVVCGARDSYEKVCCGCSLEILKAGSGIVVSYCSSCRFSFDAKESFGPNLQRTFSFSASIVNILIFSNGCCKARCPFSRTVNLRKVLHLRLDRERLASRLKEVEQFIGW